MYLRTEPLPRNPGGKVLKKRVAGRRGLVPVAALTQPEREGEAAKMTDPDPYSLQRLVDRAQIADLLARYCRAVDRRDFDDLRAVYHPDAVENHSSYNGDIDGFIAYLKQRHQDIPFSMHAVTNMAIEFTGPDTAVVETYLICLQTYPPAAAGVLTHLAGATEGPAGETAHLLLAGRYVDQITRRGGAWRFAKRDAVYDSGLLLAGRQTAMDDSWNMGRRDFGDQIYTTLAALGRPR